MKKILTITIISALLAVTSVTCLLFADASEIDNTVYTSDESSFDGQYISLNNEEELRAQIKETDDEKIRDIVKEKYGFDPYKEEKITFEMENKILSAEIEYKNEILIDLVNRVADSKAGDPELRLTKDQPVRIDIDTERYCNIIKMCCNAYNSFDFEMSDIDRIRMIDHLNDSYNSISDYVYKTGDDNNPLVTETYELIEKTIVPENGYQTLRTKDV